MRNILAAVLFLSSFFTYAEPTLPKAKVDFNAFLKLAKEVEPYRAKRLISLSEFNKKSNEANTIILDTRSKEMYDQMHVKGAIYLDFTDFTQAKLEKLIPNKNTHILIYCNNNFDDEPRFFATKMYIPPKPSNKKPITLALNIPTYINLYGYGYRNIYELSEFVSVNHPDIQFEGLSAF